jgi:hypothetical protein
MSSTLLTIFADERCSSYEALERLLCSRHDGLIGEELMTERFFAYFLRTVQGMCYPSTDDEASLMKTADFHHWATGMMHINLYVCIYCLCFSIYIYRLKEVVLSDYNRS